MEYVTNGSFKIPLNSLIHRLFLIRLQVYIISAVDAQSLDKQGQKQQF
jgi:hypothetical protein